MPIVTPQTMQKRDALTLEKENISAYDLMVRAAGEVYRYANKHGLFDDAHHIAIFAGPGNNGGDALVMARLFVEDGYNISVHCINQDSANETFNRALRDLPVKCAPSANVETSLKTADVIIDGLFGIGLNSAPRAPYDALIDAINQCQAPVLSIDIPSGLNAFNGLAEGACIRAKDTIVIESYKTGNLLNDALDYSGTLHTVSAGIHPINTPTTYKVLNADVTLPPRKINTHKYDHGAVLIVGGSAGMEGAPVLSARAALRSGAGLAKIAYHPSASTAMYTDPNIMAQKIDPSNIKELTNKIDVIIFGVGLSQDASMTPVLKVLLETNIPVIIDADGLKHLYEIIKQKSLDLSHVVITPHAGEMAFLTNRSSSDVLVDPFSTLDVLKPHHLTTVLKGPVSLIAARNHITFAPVANPALAKAGMGDVLSGIIAGRFGTTKDMWSSIHHAHVIQKHAAQIGSARFSSESLLATDLIKCLPDAIKMLQ